MKNTIEQKMTMIEEQLEQELNKSKSGKLGGKMLSLLGAVIGIAGVILGGKIVLVIIGGVLIGLGQMVQGKSRGETSQQVFDRVLGKIVPVPAGGMGIALSLLEINAFAAGMGEHAVQHEPYAVFLSSRRKLG